MKEKLAKKLKGFFDQAEELFPDKSTEFILEIAAQNATREMKCSYDCGDIAEALMRAGD